MIFTPILIFILG